MATRKTATRTTVPAPREDSNNLDVQVIDVTPKMAKEWLRYNIANRHLNQNSVTLYAEDMAQGAWRLNGEAIKFAADETLLDGQTRLHAVIKANKTVTMLVVRGLPNQTQETMDIGRKRSTSDTLTLRGEANTTALGSILRRVVCWEKDDRRFRTPVSIAQMTELLEQHPEIRRSAEMAARIHLSFKLLPISALGTAHYLIGKTATQPDDVPWFFQRIADGAELKAGDPILILRAKAMNDRENGKRIRDYRALAYIVRTWNATRSKEAYTRLQVAPDAVAQDIKP